MSALRWCWCRRCRSCAAAPRAASLQLIPHASNLTRSHDRRGAGDPRQAGHQGAAQEGGGTRSRLSNRKRCAGGGPAHLPTVTRAAVCAAARVVQPHWWDVHCKSRPADLCTFFKVLAASHRRPALPNVCLTPGRRSSTCWSLSTACPASMEWLAPAQPARRPAPQPAVAHEQLAIGCRAGEQICKQHG